jgi:hypothetical protein
MVMAKSSSVQNLAVYFGSKSWKRAYIPDSDRIITVKSPNSILNNCWVPPSSMPPDDSSDDYHQQILREDGYLLVCSPLEACNTPMHRPAGDLFVTMVLCYPLVVTSNCIEQFDVIFHCHPRGSDMIWF